MRGYRLMTVLTTLATGGAALGSTTLPPMKPGLWMSTMVMHMNIAGQPPDTDNTPMVHYQCMDATSMAAGMKMMAGALPGCSTDIEGGGMEFTIAIDCTNPQGMTGTIHGVTKVTMHGDSAMHMVANSTSALSGMNAKMDMEGDTKWMGGCPAGVMPGDYGTMQDGVFKKQGNSFAKP